MFACKARLPWKPTTSTPNSKPRRNAGSKTEKISPAQMSVPTSMTMLRIYKKTEGQGARAVVPKRNSNCKRGGTSLRPTADFEAYKLTGT